MSKKRKTYTPYEKANIVLEVHREESTFIETFNKYNVSPQLFSRWRTKVHENVPGVFDEKAIELELMKKTMLMKRRSLLTDYIAN